MMSKNMWEERYSSGSYLYGTEPNTFFKSQLDLLPPGRILLPADGQGRNGVYAAEKGWEVVCFDISKSAKQKALELAASKKVKIDYLLSGWEEIVLENEVFDAIALIYAHTPGDRRRIFHKKMAGLLKQEGTVILEAFSKNQLRYTSGGPTDLNLLYSEEEIREDFKMLKEVNIQEVIISLEEGSLHKGNASVIRLTGEK
jgi:SAM-dependent methyltransferase